MWPCPWRKNRQLINIIRRWGKSKTQDHNAQFENLFRIIREHDVRRLRRTNGVEWNAFLSQNAVVYCRSLLLFFFFRIAHLSAYFFSCLSCAIFSRSFATYVLRCLYQKTNNSKFNTYNLCNSQNNNLSREKEKKNAVCSTIQHTPKSINSTYVKMCTGHEKTR